uniref:Cytochrome P450 n=1 Tax=Megaselia scalaris TaxID=36166 RepID=T1GM25_MEGSC
MYGSLKRFDILFYFFPAYYKLQKQLSVFRKYMKKFIIIEERREYIQDSLNIDESQNNSFYAKRKLAFLDNLLTAKIDNKPLEYKDILDEVSTFLFEGHDTTASAVSFLFYSLSRHPEVQEKLYKEQMSLSSDPNWEPTYEEIQEMKYMELTIKESLRLFPSVPGIGRTPQTDLDINGQKVPAYSTIIILLMAMGYNEDYFDKPCEFIPERFIADNRTGANPFDHVPFSAGPRNCIGQKFALMEVKAIMCQIIRNFKILPPVDGLKTNGIFDISSENRNVGRTKWDPLMSAALTLKSCNGIYIRLEER